jgi:hypothetical protein
MLIKAGRAADAIKLLRQSLATLEKSFAQSPTDGLAHYRMAMVQQGLGNAYAALAGDETTSATMRLANSRSACSWFKKSQEIHQSFLAAGTLTGDDRARLDTINQEISKCTATIARLTQTGK